MKIIIYFHNLLDKFKNKDKDKYTLDDIEFIKVK